MKKFLFLLACIPNVIIMLMICLIMKYIVKLDYSSVNAICKNSSEVLVYGFKHCAFTQIKTTLRKPCSPLKKVYKNIWFFESGECSSTGEKIQCIHIEPDKAKNFSKKMACQCKAAIINLVFENYKRKKKGLPLIVLLFCIDIDDNKYPYDIGNFTSKAADLNNKITHSELRRCYKLACEFEDERIRAVANESFKFVRLKKKEDGFEMVEIAPPWEEKEWRAKWALRKTLTNVVEKKNPWREQIKTFIDDFDKSFEGNLLK